MSTRTMFRRIPILVALTIAASAAAASARPIPVESVPPELTAWIPWVLDEVPDRACVTSGERKVCAWPSRLSLSLDAQGGRFQLDGTADVETEVALPGDATRWPLDVASSDRPVPVLPRETRPSVRLPAGAFRIQGRFAWTSLPESLPVPLTVGLIDLSVDGVRIDFPRRDAQGLLWIQARSVEADDGERLDLEVSRRISDGVPMTVDTRIVARASGRAREVDLGRVVLDGTVPLSLASDVPARLDSDGNLRIQVRAGTWKINVAARTDGSAPAAFRMTKRPAPWPGEETWVWQGDDALRQVTLTGGTGVDPSRTSLDDDWKTLAARILRPGEELGIRTERRGEPEPPPSSVQLNREIWMDTNGRGYTLRDRLDGTLTKTWRLDLQAPAVLGHAVIGGQDQLVTASPATGLPGIEVRGSRLDLLAESRIEGAERTLPAVGWSEDASSLKATLHLAPGWRLLSASGVDVVRGTWLDSWSLLGFLFVLLMALAIGRLAGWPWGALALLTLAVNHGESQEPFLVWVSLVAVTGLLMVAPEGRFRTLCRWWWMGTVVVVALETVPFIVREVREGLHPQVAGEVWHGTDLLTGCARMGVGGRTSRDAEYAQSAVREAANAVAKEEAADEVYSKVQAGAKDDWKAKRKLSSLQNDPNAVVQTGPGVPTWQWEAYLLEWSGPVERTHTLRLWLLSPWQNLLLALFRVVMTLLLAWRLVTLGRRATPPRKPGDEHGGEVPPEAEGARMSQDSGTLGEAIKTLIVFALLAAAAPSTPMAADRTSIPDRAVLDDLKARLTRPEPCLPDCASTSRLTIDVVQERLRIVADVHAGAPVAWPVPGPAQNWIPGEVVVDGKTEAGIALLENGFLHLRLAAGTHRVELTGPAGRGGTVTLEFANTPHRVDVSAPGWAVEGLREDGRVARSIQLLRKVDDETAASNDAAAAALSTALPPWLEVTRVVDAGIPWLVHTTVRRVSPTGSPVVVRMPLLSGESVTESELRVEAGHVVVSLGRDDSTVAWESTLDEQEVVTLEAPRGVPWSETWILQCSPVWQCAPEGLAPVRHQAESRWQPEYRPWPGDKLSIAFRRPLGTAGQTVTIDRAVLRVSPGTRLQSSVLELEYRSSQGGVQTVVLPEGARVNRVAVGERDEPIQEAGGRVAFSLQPGAQKVTINWQQTGGMSVMQHAPAVTLGAPAANARMVIKVPSERWLLFCGGPSWGPAVLYWGFLLALVAFGFVLGRVPASPLRGWQWVLLFIGLANVPVPAALVVVGWFLLLKRRMDEPPMTRWRFNGMQVLLVGWTVVAAVILYVTVHSGLLGAPGMRVAGMGSSDHELVWYADRIGNSMPVPWVVSLPRWVWRITMLAWSFWLAWSLVKWVPWAWRSFSTNGLWWKKRR